jgi:tripartite-type tricarboxylate transporter receptor subunit TctC
MPPAIVKILNESLAKTLQAPDMREKLSVEAIEPQAMSPEAFGAFMKEDLARWTKLAKEKNIQLD